MRLVMKFGGTSLADLSCIRRSCELVKKEVDAGAEVAVVVSAMAGETDKLVSLVSEAGGSVFDSREYDAVVSTGEQVSAGIFALTLQSMGVSARSWQGWQIPIRTDEAHARARILDIDKTAIEARFKESMVAVCCGFQGISERHRTTTLGRGGSDTLAVALAIALEADRCDIYTDVDGIYTTDPRIVPKARKIDVISHEEMLEMASLGAKVLQTRSVELATNYNVSVRVLSTFEDKPGTLVSNEDEIMEKQIVTGIAYDKNVAKVSLNRIADKPGISAMIFGPLAEADINVDMIVQSLSSDGKTTDMTFTVPRLDLDRTIQILKSKEADIAYADLIYSNDVAKLSVIGVGMRSHAGVAQTMFSTLAENNINIQVISTSEIKISTLIHESYIEIALRSLHTAYGLDATD